MTGARAIAKKEGFDIVYDHTYPPSTVDYSPIVRAIQATNADLVFVASYPLDSVGMVRAATELGLKAQMFAAAWSACNMRRSCSSLRTSSIAS